MRSPQRFCVIGAGNGGLAMAGHLAVMEEDVTLWNRGEERIKEVKKQKGIEVTGIISGFGRIRLATTNIKEAISKTDVIMVAIPATGHDYVARISAKCLKSGQIIILNPGRTGGALEFVNVLRQSGVANKVLVAEAQTFLYTCRTIGSNKTLIKRIKNSVPLAAIPAYVTPHVLEVVNSVFSQFVAADNVLDTSFDNIGAILHPALLLLNASKVEQNQQFDYYVEGITPSVVRVLEVMDRERIAVANALGVHTHTVREWLYLAYDAVGKTLYEALQANSAYKGILSPNTLDHRYITEDVPMSLVPMTSIGDMLGIPTPTIKAIIQLASIIHSTDYMKQGRSDERLGLSGLSVREIRRFVLEGVQPIETCETSSYKKIRVVDRDLPSEQAAISA